LRGYIRPGALTGWLSRNQAEDRTTKHAKRKAAPRRPEVEDQSLEGAAGDLGSAYGLASVISWFSLNIYG
jgi:hypothetical protein